MSGLWGAGRRRTGAPRVRNRTVHAVTAVLVAAVSAACGGGSSGNGTAKTAGSPAPSASSQSADRGEKPQPFTVSSYAYKAIPQGTDAGAYYVEWAAVIHNPNAASYGTFPTLTITAYDRAGGVLGTDDQVLNALPPEATEAFAGQIDALGGKPARVTVTYSKVGWYPTTTHASDYPPFMVTGARYHNVSYAATTTGIVSNPYAHDWDQLALTALYYDAAGKLVGGSTDFLDSLPAHASKPFEVQDMFDLSTQPARVQVMAMPWGGGDPSEWDQVAAGG